MPVLTDRQEPDDYDRPPPDDPNEYALRYLFEPNRPGVEYQRTGQTLFYAGVATNWLAFGLYLAWSEFDGWPWPTALAVMILAVSTLSALFLFQRHRGLAFGLVVLTLTLALTFQTLTFLTPWPTEPASYYFFFLPGSLASLLGALLLQVSKI